MDTSTAQALIRFGLGRRADAALPADPHGWLAGQLNGDDRALATPGPTAADGLAALRADRAARKANDKEGATHGRDLLRDEAQRIFATLMDTDAPFRERLVWFWFNHFTVSLKRGEIAGLVGPYVREAIRPHVTGRFSDLLLAVMRHPAMLLYLDNAQSIGPDSPAGERLHRGLNENLARECLELHTVTPAAGYTQADVTAFARVLTGWSIGREDNEPPFLFRPRAHEPGTQTVMGRGFPGGEQGGLDALAWLGTHPATYRNIATKLVRHFVADAPPPDAVARIVRVLADTQGDLKAAYLELIRLPPAWTPLTKLRSPADYTIAVLRAVDLPADNRPDMRGVDAGLGEPFFAAPLPNGWPDTAADWAGPEALLRRVDWAWGVAGRAAPLRDPSELADATLGPLLPAATATEIRRAGSRREGLALLLASPEFQRR